MSENKDWALELGGRLRSVRLRQGKSLSAAAARLKIREEYLHSLEEGCYDDLPEFVYVLGFVRSYARYLGLPADEVSEDFRQALSGRRVRSLRGFVQEAPHPRLSLHYIFWLALVFCVLLYIVWFNYSYAIWGEAFLSDLSMLSGICAVERC